MTQYDTSGRKSNAIGHGLRARFRSSGPVAALVAAVLVLVIIGWSIANDLGNAGTLLAFHLSFTALLALVWPRPRVDAYTFLAVFLWLGFWVKFVAHLFFLYPF